MTDKYSLQCSVHLLVHALEHDNFSLKSDEFDRIEFDLELDKNVVRSISAKY